MNLSKEIEIRIEDPRILLNEFFGYLSFTTGLITALLLIINLKPAYQVLNQILLLSCAFQNLPLLMVYIPQWRVLLSAGILGIVITNYFATLPIGQAFREGLFVGMIKVDYSHEALVRYHPDKYPPEAQILGNKDSQSFKEVYSDVEKGFIAMFSNMINVSFEFIRKLFTDSKFQKNLGEYLKLIAKETWVRSGEMILEIKKGNFKAFVNDAIRSQFFSSLMRIISATPLFIIAAFELTALLGFYEKSDLYISQAHIWTNLSLRALAFSSFIDGLSKIAFGFMRESFMMKLGGVIFAAAQLYLMFYGESALQLVIPLSLAGLAAYPIVEGERLRKLALEKA
jgi:hypothetical protein